MRDVPWLIARIVMALAIGITLGRILTGCTVDATHRFVLSIEASDPCLLTFPACDGAGETYCADADGVRVEGCRVGCIAARDLMCVAGDDGYLMPECHQVAGDDVIQVPVLCMSE